MFVRIVRDPRKGCTLFSHFTAFDSLPTESFSSAEKVLRNSVLSLLVLGGPRSSILFDSLSREGEEEISSLEESNFNSRFRNLINYLQLFELRNEALHDVATITIFSKRESRVIGIWIDLFAPKSASREASMKRRGLSPVGDGSRTVHLFFSSLSLSRGTTYTCTYDRLRAPEEPKVCRYRVQPARVNTCSSIYLRRDISPPP